MISVSGLAKRFGRVQALVDATFTAPDAAITTLLGANGSGKTTCLRIIGGLIRPNKGKAEVDGIDATKNPFAVRKRLGVFPDKFGLYPRLTAREHIAYFARLHDLEGRELHDAVERVARSLRMEDFLDRPTRGFSSGQRMKVALARAMVHKPQNLILDEPSRGLDVMSIRLLRDILRQLRTDGCCILFSSHVMAEVELMSDRIVMIAHGRVTAEGSAAELKAQAGCDDLEDAFVRLAELDEKDA